MSLKSEMSLSEMLIVTACRQTCAQISIVLSVQCTLKLQATILFCIGDLLLIILIFAGNSNVNTSPPPHDKLSFICKRQQHIEQLGQIDQ